MTPERFVLVHEVFHGPWYWDRLVPGLRRPGIDPVAVYLPAEDPTAGASEYADVISDAVINDDTLVVGHSMSGLAFPSSRDAANR